MDCRKFFDFGTPVIFRILGVFGVDFLLEHFCCGSLFRMFLNILIFTLFNDGFSPCMTVFFPMFEELLPN